MPVGRLETRIIGPLGGGGLGRTEENSPHALHIPLLSPPLSLGPQSIAKIFFSNPLTLNKKLVTISFGKAKRG